MCARYTLRTSAKIIRDLFEIDEVPEMPDRFNIAPTQEVPGITESRDGERRVRMLRWGLIPRWANNINIGVQMINAKAETLAEKSAFRNAFESRRCLIPADGFFEWKTIFPEAPQQSLFGGEPQPSKEKPRKQPYHFTMRNGAPFAFAGLWEKWSDPQQRLVESFTIITTEPNELMAELHDRMPVILHREDYAIWLSRDEQNLIKLGQLLKPYPANEMKKVAVNPVVGNPRNDVPECIEPFSAA
jgi:putative SOS response-associated peptidase YedK